MAPRSSSSTPSKTQGEAASTSLSKVWSLGSSSRKIPTEHQRLPRTSKSRLRATSSETILYLAYGSNLSAKTFKGTRGIQPLSAINVHVPSLDLTFDLVGLPYIEPCFANSRYHIPPPPASTTDYHKDRWHKGLVGVVYEVTPEDYRTIIATEGGGSSYQDVVVECYALPDGTKVVNADPKGKSFTAHTLLQPGEGDANLTDNRRVHRPDPSYAQPSARYLKLITSGAEEHALPDDYLAYLYNIRPYTITTIRQRVGQGLLFTLYMPLLLTLIGLAKVLADKKGKMPTWLANVMSLFFRTLWTVYDGCMVGIFGDGERTMKVNNKETGAGLGGDADEERALGKRWCEKSILLGGRERNLRSSQ